MPKKVSQTKPKQGVSEDSVSIRKPRRLSSIKSNSRLEKQRTIDPPDFLKDTDAKSILQAVEDMMSPEEKKAEKQLVQTKLNLVSSPKPTTPKKRGRKPKSPTTTTPKATTPKTTKPKTTTPKTKKGGYVKKGRRKKEVDLEDHFKNTLKLLNRKSSFPNDFVCLANIIQKASNPIVKTIEEVEEYFPLMEESVPIRTNMSNDPISLPRFAHCQFQENDSASTKLLIFTGGSIQCISWMPTRLEFESEENEKLYVAVGVHQEINPVHMNGQKYVHKNMIQIWEFQGLENSWNVETKPSPSAFMAMCICHEYGCILDLQWCPFTSTYEDEVLWNHVNGKKILGLLGACFTDGSLRVFCVPHPETFEKSMIDDDVQTIFLSLTPILSFRVGDTSINCMRWKIEDNHISILFSNSSGQVGIYTILSNSNIEQDEKELTPPTSITRGHNSAVRCLAWHPTMSNIYTTASVQAPLKVWDKREPLNPIISFQYITKNTFAVYWKQEPAYLYVASSFGVLREISEESHIFQLHLGSIWEVSISEFLTHAATCSDDGSVKVTSLVKYEQSKVKKPKRKTTEVARLTKDEHADIVTLTFPNNEVTVSKTDANNISNFPDRLVTWGCVSWSPNQYSCQWLMCGSNTGILCVIPFEEKVLTN